MVTMVGDNIIELRRLFTDYQAFDKKLLLRFEMRLANSRFTAFSSPPPVPELGTMRLGVV